MRPVVLGWYLSQDCSDLGKRGRREDTQRLKYGIKYSDKVL